jgi:pimeloyl-ACP methyl ester carboxylesterase
VGISYQPPRSQWADLDGPVHYVDHGGPSDGPLLVCVHGLGGSLLNWSALAPRLSDTARVVAVDLAGFGRTRAVVRSASISANQQLLNRFLTEVIAGPAILVGNSMGGLITTLQADAHPETVAGAVLIDPALPIAVGARPDPLVTAMFAMYMVPPLGRAALRARRRRSGPEEAAMDLLRLCCVDADRVPAEVVEQHIALAGIRRTYDEVDDAMLDAARSLLRVLARRRRHAEMMASMQGPVLLLHGDKDRLVSIASARAAAKANPTWRFEVAHGVGHVPQLEVPDWTAERILHWLATDAATAAALTRHTHPVTDRTTTDPRRNTDPQRNIE